MIFYTTLSDEDLIALARNGDDLAEDQLAVRYSKLVRACARPYFLAGGDSEDLIQEGMLGLLSAIRKFDPGTGVSFKTYAEQCIRNRLLTAIESASRLKHTPLNDGISFEYLLSEEPGRLHAAQEDSFSRRTEDQGLAREQNEESLVGNVSALSRLEREVLEMYLQGMSYKEIADRVNKPEKSIDNAVQRIRRKLVREN